MLNKADGYLEKEDIVITLLILCVSMKNERAFNLVRAKGKVSS
jgi:hypothetical protein